MTRRRLAKLSVLVVLVAAIAAIYLSPLRDYMTREQIKGFVENLRGLWYGPAAFVLAFAIGCVFAIPASLFVIAAAIIWGWAWGFVYSLIGGTLGAVASFFIGRFVGEGILHRFGRVGRMVAKQVDHAGFRSLIVLRNIPGIPFAAMNYGAGAAGVRFRDYLPATIIGMSPSMLVFAYCSDALFNGSMTEADALKRLFIACAMMIAITLLPLLIKRWAKRGAAGTQPADVVEPVDLH